jgi:hypothetical protein
MVFRIAEYEQLRLLRLSLTGAGMAETFLALKRSEITLINQVDELKSRVLLRVLVVEGSHSRNTARLNAELLKRVWFPNAPQARFRPPLQQLSAGLFRLCQNPEDTLPAEDSHSNSLSLSKNNTLPS